MVLATQNPVEQEGTYPLPEAQLDRFMFLIELTYPSEEEEIQIARSTTGDDLVTLDALMSGEEILGYQQLVRRIPVPDHIYRYAVRLVRKTRPQETGLTPVVEILCFMGGRATEQSNTLSWVARHGRLSEGNTW